MRRMVKRIDNLQPISLYNLAGNILYTVNSKTYINNKVFGSNISITNFSTFKNELYYFQNSVLYNIKLNNWIESFYMGNVNVLEIVAENVLFSYKKISRKEYQYFFHDFNYNLLWTHKGNESITPFYGLIQYSKRFDETKIDLREIETGKFLWSYQLPEDYTIYLSPQVIDDVLFFMAFKDNDRCKLVVGLDLNLGNILWEHEDELPYDKNIAINTLDEDSKLCYSCGGSEYQIFNPILGEIVLNKDVTSLFPEDFVVYKNLYSENKLWFVGQVGEEVKFGFFNTISNELELFQDFPSDTFVRIQSMEYGNSQLYMLDSDNTLHIFEKE